MERKVSVYPFPFGTRVFMHRNGVIREAEYRGMRIKDTGICGNNVDTEHIFWFGSKLGEEKFKVSMPIYKTAEDAAQETNPVQYEVLNIESFSLKYLPYLVWDGIQFCGWLWDGSRPVKRATREPLRVCKIYGGKVTFVDYSGNEYYAEHFRRFYQTAKQCREANKPKIVMLDEEGDDFAKQKHDEFYAYVKHHCPGFEDKIEWEYFQAYKTMPWNLSQQVKFWSNYGIAFKQGHHVCIEVGKLPYSIGLNYLRNLQEMSVTAVDDLMGLKERSREEAFNIIREWTKEFTEKYGNYYFDGSYYDEIDAFIEEKLRTI